jgi:tetratricopeptide (TPR) repeat protein
MFLAGHPRSSAARYSIGLAYAGEGRDDLAMGQFQQALSLNDEDPDVYLQIGLIDARRRQWAEAAAWYQRALERDPTHVVAHVNLAMAAEHMGQGARAAAHYRTVLQTTQPGRADEDAQAFARAALGRLGSAAR